MNVRIAICASNAVKTNEYLDISTIRFSPNWKSVFGVVFAYVFSAHVFPNTAPDQTCSNKVRSVPFCRAVR